MRVAVLFEYPTLWGGERSMLSVLERLNGRSANAVAIAPAKGPLAEALRSQNIQHISFQAFGSDGTRRPREEIVPELQTTVRRIAPDIVHANSLSMSVLTGLLDDSCVRVGHLRDIIRLSKNVIRLLNQNDRLIAVSHATRSHHVQQGLDEMKCDVIYNGVDCDLFQPRETSDSIKEELRLPNDAMLALTVGQIGLRKGLDVLVRAMCAVGPKIPSLHFLIAGQRTSNKQESIDFESQLRRTIDNAGLSDRVHWLGYRNDIPKLMNVSSLLIHAANQEPLGRVLLEAAASGLAIIATRVGGTEEILDHGVSAWLVNKGDYGAIANAIECLSHDSAQRSTLAKAARDRAAGVFSVTAASSDLMSFWVQSANAS